MSLSLPLQVSNRHVQRILWDYMGWTLNYTTYLMVFIMKYTSFCYDLYDGLVDKVFLSVHSFMPNRKKSINMLKMKVILVVCTNNVNVLISRPFPPFLTISLISFTFLAPSQVLSSSIVNTWRLLRERDPIAYTFDPD